MEFEKIKNGFVIKSIKGESFKIPSKIYPLSKKKDVKIFYKNNAKEIADFKDREKLEKIMNGMRFKIGHCYSNADTLTKALNKTGIKAKLYSGWVLPITVDTPIHHAWVIIEDKYVIDPTASFIDIMAEIELMRELKETNYKPQPGEFKKLYAQKLVDIKKDMTNFELAVDNVTSGLYVYVGTEDTIENAKITFNNLMASVDEHPSYLNFGKAGNVVGNASETQKYIREIQGGY